VGHVHRRDVQFVLEFLNLRSHLGPEFGVEIRQRLVHQEKRRFADDGPTQRDPLLLPSREILRFLIEKLLDIE
jgi:hypothetical protein